MEVLDNKCPNCNAKIAWNPKSQLFDCEYCGSKFTLEQMQQYNNASNEKANSDTVEKMDIDMYTCKNCGASVVADEQTTATSCVYCGSTTILKDRLSGALKPSKIIPFKKVKEDAILAFKGISKGKPFMPKLFNKQENIEKITGVYIPFWVYDCNLNGDMSCNCEDVRHWSTYDYSYTEIKKYSVVKNGKMQFYNVPVDGSTRFKDELMDSIEPFNFKELIDYNHAYLSGFLAEKYDVESEDAKTRAMDRINNTAIDTMKNSIVNHSNKVLNTNNMISNITKCDYILLPVWMVNIKYNNKMYSFAMNGQTGKLIGDIPLDKKKVAIWSILTFVIILGIELIFVLITGVR